MLETFRKGCRRLGFSHLLNLYEKVEDLAVLWVDDLAVFGYITAEHFPVSFGTLHRPSFLSRVNLLRTRLPERREFLCSLLGDGRIG